VSAALEDWIGRRETRRQLIEAESLRRFAAAVDAPLDVERVPPPLAHWAFFNDIVAAGQLGEDGHPRRGGFMPPVTLPRRMFAAAETRFAGPLDLGVEAELEATIADVRRRSGRSGELVLVEVDRRISQAGRVRIQERQTIVYREAGEATAPVTPAPDINQSGDEVWTPDGVQLFRYSAATFNAHRIHHDLPYAREVEGYPGLVVHGPLTAAKLCGLAGRLAGAPLTRFSFRALAPLFEGQPILLRPGEDPGAVSAIRCDGTVAMSAMFESAA
jgi:3-methylfumaryl-CoA hydratase